MTRSIVPGILAAAVTLFATSTAPPPASAADPAVQQLQSRIFRLEAEVRSLSRPAPSPSPPARIADPVLTQRLQTLELQVVGLQAEVATLRKAVEEMDRAR